MRIIQGDLWDWHDRGHTIVVTTNIGWDPETERNNMGAGVALQAAIRFPWLSRKYGQYCRRHGAATTVVHLQRSRLVLFPVKPLTEGDPERSWSQDASLQLIEKSATELAALRITNVAMALPGCGNGGRRKEEVMPILERHLLGLVSIVELHANSSLS